MRKAEEVGQSRERQAASIGTIEMEAIQNDYCYPRGMLGAGDHEYDEQARDHRDGEIGSGEQKVEVEK